MKFAELSIVRLNNDVITASGGFDPDNCGCYDPDLTTDPCDDE